MNFLNLLTYIPFFCANSNIDVLSDTSGSVDGVSTLAKAISDYGFPVVMLAVFFLIFIFVIVAIFKNNAKMMKDMLDRQKTSDSVEQDIIMKLVDSAIESKLTGTDSTNNTNVADTLKALQDAIGPLQQAVKELSDQKDNEDVSNNYHKDLIGAYIDVNMAFKDASRATQTKLGCDRIAIYVFHNGNKSMHGLPFFKMSCIHEWTSRGNTLRGKSHTDMPLHLFNDFIEELWQSSIYKIEDVSRVVEENDSIKEFVSYSNTKSMYMIAMKDDNNAITGFVVAEFDSIDTFEHDTARSETIKSILEDMILRISPIVSNKYIYHGSSK